MRVQALLFEEQKQRLDFLASTLPGNPPVTGLIRDAVSDYLDRQFDGQLEETFVDQNQLDLLKLVR